MILRLTRELKQYIHLYSPSNGSNIHTIKKKQKIIKQVNKTHTHTQIRPVLFIGCCELSNLFGQIKIR